MPVDTKTSERSPKVAPAEPLADLLRKEYSALENYDGKGFICLETALRTLTADRIHQWSTERPLSQEHEDCPQKDILVQKIRAGASLLFCVLVLAQLEHLTLKLLSRGFNDAVLFDDLLFAKGCTSARLTKQQRHNLEKYRSYVGVTFNSIQHQEIPRDSTLPFLRRENGSFGSYGVVYQVTVAAGHLGGYAKTVVAEKKIRARTDRSGSQWRKLFREVETLQKRKHPSIIPLLASYYLETNESGDYVKSLHLIFPWADMDLKKWMNSAQIPANLQGKSKQERQSYIYRSIYMLVSAVSYLHREIEGIITSHHDLKPSNIVLVDGELKIADLGRSHLRPLIEGSATQNASELGTYDYQPPEYWKEDGSHAEMNHGRAFDVWAMGCIIIELATLIVHEWKSGKLAQFKNKRRRNADKEHQVPEDREAGQDDSFHNNLSVVKSWVQQLIYLDSNPKLERMLEVAINMMAKDPRNRLYMWEVEMDLNEALSPEDDRIPKLESGALCEAVPPSAGYWSSEGPGEMRRSEVPDKRQNPFHRAARRQDRARVVRLWELGWPLFLKDPEGNTPLELLKQSSDSFLCNLESSVIKLIEAAGENDINTIRDLRKAGLSPLMSNEGGYVAIHQAIQSGQTRAVDCLLETKTKEQLAYGTKWHIGSRVPLQTAAAGGHVEILKRILHESPDLNAPTHPVETPLILATESRNVEAVRLLTERGAEAWPSHLDRYPDDYGLETPLLAASEQGDLDILKLLLEAKGSDKCMERKNAWGQTPLLRAVDIGYTAYAEILLQHGASLHVVAADGWNVVHKAAKKGLLDFFTRHIEEFTLDELTIRTTGGEIPWQIAEDHGHKEMAKLLKTRVKALRRSINSVSASGAAASRSSSSMSVLQQMKSAVKEWYTDRRRDEPHVRRSWDH